MPPDPPTVTLPSPPATSDDGIVVLAPEDEAYLKASSVKFTFSVERPNVDECTIDIDDGDKEITLTTVTTGTEYDKSQTLGSGKHEWFIECIDDDGDEFESDIREFIIDTKDPVLIVPSTAKQGDILVVKGEHYWAEELELELLDDDDDLVDIWSFDVNNEGEFEKEILLRFDLDLGTYTIETSQSGHSKSSESESFTLGERNPAVSTDKDIYFKGQTVKISGAEFSPNGRARITVTKPDLSSIQIKDAITKADGSFIAAFALDGTRALGTYTVTVEDTRHITLTATVDFELDEESVANDDYDKDGVANAADNCPYKMNADQLDTDGDGTGDACDTTPNGDVKEEDSVDFDGDGVSDIVDNCPAAPNPTQSDSDGDAIGDACDPTDDSEDTTPGNIPEDPELQEPSAGFPFLLVILLVAVLIIGGTVGYLAYEGKLDFNDLQGSFNALFHPEAKGPGTASTVNGQQAEELKAFIFGERSKGFDDLTIRNALVEKGWNQGDVDSVFQLVYAE
ncbi:hypothetical protein GOV07_01250 [Candidatus Woesearchaeota archaeon]|nr:hypothetical protein [Candidatus Woesearchaeota archaeon]